MKNILKKQLDRQFCLNVRAGVRLPLASNSFRRSKNINVRNRNRYRNRESLSAFGFRCPIVLAIAIPITDPDHAFPAALSGPQVKPTGVARGCPILASPPCTDYRMRETAGTKTSCVTRKCQKRFCVDFRYTPEYLSTIRAAQSRNCVYPSLPPAPKQD